MHRIPIRNVSGTDYFYRIDFDTTQNMREIINQLKQLPDVLSVEPNYLFELHSFDPYFPLQWALPKIQATSAWGIESGNETIKIAVLDGGVDYYHSNPHPDLMNNLLNYGGYWGINLINPGNQPIDVRGHGTHVLGIIGAVRGKSIGVAGMADVSLINIKVAEISTIPMDIAALGVDTAVVLGAKIINMSYGYQYNLEDPNSFEYFDIFGTAIQNAYNEDVVMVASVGNTGNDLSDYCGNSSSYTDNVLYQGTSPLWKIAYSEIDTIIYCQLNSDGVILSYEYDPDTFFPYTNSLYLITGDNDNNQTASISFRSFLSFDIASLKMSNMINAVLKVYQEQSFGDGVLGEYPVLIVDGDTDILYCISYLHW